MFDCSQITIVGTGLLGTSVGLALKRADYRGAIVGLGRRSQSLEKAHAAGAVDRWTTDYADALANSELALVAVPLGAFDAVFEKIGTFGSPGLIVTDVGSAKTTALASSHAHLGSTQRFIGSHPMAGTEHRGPEAAEADLFVGKPCIVTNDDCSNAQAAEVVQSLWQTLEMTIIPMSAAEHDAKAAVISHLPHASAVLLVQLANELGGWDIASTGFQDTTRLASSNPPVRADILMANREQISHTLARFAERIEQLRQTLDQADHDKLLELLESSQAARDQWTNARTG